MNYQLANETVADLIASAKASLKAAKRIAYDNCTEFYIYGLEEEVMSDGDDSWNSSSANC